MAEDWFIDQIVADEVQKDPVTNEPFVDAVTGMPDFRQASFEILTVWHGKIDAAVPWAEFDRYGKFYYDARSLDVATHGSRTIAYIAYGLGGLVAVDVTGFDTATPSSTLTATYLGYAPAPPAHGPVEPTGEQTQALFSYHGAGKLKEAGYNEVRAIGTRVLGVDHFAGVLVMDDADSPETAWRGPNAPYDNDDPNLGDGILGDHWPDTEFVTSYDMGPHDPLDHESLPAWMYDPAGPSLLVTGEVFGHGAAITLLAGADLQAAGGVNGVDVFQCAAAGGFVQLDLDLSASPADDFAARFTIVRGLTTTSEVGAAPDGSPTITLSIGHADGVAASSRYLYVADGPHGVSAWEIADAAGVPIDDLHAVANTVQDEYPVTLPTGETIYPATHAVGVRFDPTTGTVLALCQSVGLRRIDVGVVESGAALPGAPALIAPQPEDIFEHSGEEEEQIGSLHKQDHAYDVALRGNLAFVADGSNGVTVWDLSKDPTNPLSGFLAGNIGGDGGNKPPLGRATGIVLHREPNGREFAFVAAGPRGVGVVAVEVDALDRVQMSFVKVFEPIKIEDDKVGAADGRAADVAIVRDHVLFAYDSFGIVAYSIADLIAPLPAGVDPTEIWSKNLAGQTLFDHRPEAVGHFVLDEVPGFEGVDGGALGLAVNDVGGRATVLAAYGVAGLAFIDWTAPAAPALLHLAPTIGECNSAVVANGRVYVSDHDGGFTFFK